jgi:hypothetical protein
MDGSAPLHLLVLDGGRKAGAPSRAAPAQSALRVLPGGPAGELQSAIEETVEAARRVRREIEERIARALEELF